MPKMKTHKGLKKRIRITATGKVKHRKAGSAHILSHKSGDRLRSLRKPRIASDGVARRILTVISEA